MEEEGTEEEGMKEEGMEEEKISKIQTSTSDYEEKRCKTDYSRRHR